MARDGRRRRSDGRPGGPGALYLDAQQRLIGVVARDIAGGQITKISSIVNPDKLKQPGPVGDFAALAKSAM